MTSFKALMTAIYPVADIAAGRAWYAEAFSAKAYFDEPFYVGFNIGGYELGLVPAEPPLHESGNRGVIAYWGVDDASAAHARLVQLGATSIEEVRDVGGGIKTGVVCDPFGNALGVIENPHFGGASH